MWILRSSEPRTTFRLRPGAVKTVGRAPRADFIVDAALVSRLHCRITAAADKLEVVDLKSTNGTFVNGKRVHKSQLADGDTLRVGRVELTIQMADG
jgi:pSer/pThr/pTyr-binding forkhead associated (FHA) protein